MIGLQAAAAPPSLAAPGGLVSPAGLARIVRDVAARPETWRGLVRFDPAERWYARIQGGDDYEVWLLTWLEGQHTGFHDHGDSVGAFMITSGCLTERAAVAGRPAASGRRLRAGACRSFGPRYIHDVRNASPVPAVSIHAYSPPLTSMRRFEPTEHGQLRVAAEERSW